MTENTSNQTDLAQPTRAILHGWWLLSLCTLPLHILWAGRHEKQRAVREYYCRQSRKPQAPSAPPSMGLFVTASGYRNINLLLLLLSVVFHTWVGPNLHKILTWSHKCWIFWISSSDISVPIDISAASFTLASTSSGRISERSEVAVNSRVPVRNKLDWYSPRVWQTHRYLTTVYLKMFHHHWFENLKEVESWSELWVGEDLKWVMSNPNSRYY